MASIKFFKKDILAFGESLNKEKKIQKHTTYMIFGGR